MPINIQIRTGDEREAATRLIERMLGAIEDSSEETKLRMLIEATEAWDTKCKRALLSQTNPFCTHEEVPSPRQAEQSQSDEGTYRSPPGSAARRNADGLLDPNPR
jgi:hypothetical protein